MTKLEILLYNYWEHFKAEKDLALTLPTTHWKRVLLLQAINDLQVELNKLK